MTLTIDEFIRRFLMHVLPKGFHRIRHYGLLANTTRAKNINRARTLLNAETPAAPGEDLPLKDTPLTSTFVCPSCAAPMIIIDIFERGHIPRAPPIRSINAWAA